VISYFLRPVARELTFSLVGMSHRSIPADNLIEVLKTSALSSSVSLNAVNRFDDQIIRFVYHHRVSIGELVEDSFRPFR